MRGGVVGEGTVGAGGGRGERADVVGVGDGVLEVELCHGEGSARDPHCCQVREVGGEGFFGDGGRHEDDLGRIWDGGGVCFEVEED